MSQTCSLFVYGTLREPDLVEQLTGKRFPTEPATLLDYERHEPPGSYAYVLPAPGKRVPGVLIRDLDAASLAAIDEYECLGTLYDRQEVVVETERGYERAFVYVGRPDKGAVRDVVQR